MIIVVVIIGILVTVVVGVSKMVVARAASEKTRMNMQVILSAMKTYYDSQGDYPVEESDFSGKPASWADRDWQAYCRNRKLYQQLCLVPAVKKKIATLREDAVSNVEGSYVFIDGFETYMDYFRTGGIGGLPVLISAGADRTFDTEDDIRSDNR